MGLCCLKEYMPSFSENKEARGDQDTPVENVAMWWNIEFMSSFLKARLEAGEFAKNLKTSTRFDVFRLSKDLAYVWELKIYFEKVLLCTRETISNGTNHFRWPLTAGKILFSFKWSLAEFAAAIFTSRFNFKKKQIWLQGSTLLFSSSVWGSWWFCRNPVNYFAT